MDHDLNMLQFSRREFVALCGVLAASFTACSNLGGRTRAAAAYLVDPPLDDYLPIVRGFARAVLPLESAFPLSEHEVTQRLLKLFPLEREARFIGLQKTLVYFDATDLFPFVSSPLLAEERKMRDVPLRMSESDFATMSKNAEARDRASWRDFAARNGARANFAQLSFEEQRRYFELWSSSDFVIKRAFARTMRTLVLIAAFSSDRVWPKIGYAGPLIDRPSHENDDAHD
jgi:hypothetical protein